MTARQPSVPNRMPLIEGDWLAKQGTKSAWDRSQKLAARHDDAEEHSGKEGQPQRRIGIIPNEVVGRANALSGRLFGPGKTFLRHDERAGQTGTRFAGLFF